MDMLILSLGLLLLILIIYDFFFTTLSGSGAGFISKNVTSLTYRGLRFFSDATKRKVFKFSGMIVNLSVLLVWIIIVWTGLFLVYSYNPDAITNSNFRPANWIERLYYTGYVLSTLGMGNFKPVSPFYEIMTGIFSFFGFIFFTSSMTYLISVSSAVIRKRSLSRNIANLGKSPVKITQTVKNLSPSYKNQLLLSLQEQIDNHAVSHQAYPVVHFFSHENSNNCFSLNFTRLDEALSILLNNDQQIERNQIEMKLLRDTMTNLLGHLRSNFSNSLPNLKNDSIKENIRKKDFYNQLDLNELNQRRQLLTALLQNEGLNWNAVNGY